MPNSPSDALDAAQKLPTGADPAVDLFAMAKARLTGITPEMQGSPFTALPKFPVQFECRRFVIGNEMSINPDTGKKSFDPVDDKDREEYAAIMQGRYDGKTIVEKHLETFLQDGTVVVWLEWLTPKEQPAGAARPAHARTASELLDPRTPPAAEGAIPPDAKGPPAKIAQGSDVFDVNDPDKFFGESGPSHEEEDDF
jgi:hypothetical protein